MVTRPARFSLPRNSPDRASVAAGFVTGLLAGLRAKGRRAEPLLREAGLPASCLTDPHARVPVAGYAALYNLVVRALDDEGFGLFRQPLRPGTFEFLGRGMLGSRDVAQALERASRFLRLVLPQLAVSVERHGERARIVIAETAPLARRRDDPRRVFAFEWLLRLLHGLACWLAARPIALDEVRFPFAAPRHAADYALIYTEHARFGGAALVAQFDAAVLDLPVRRDAADLDAFLEGAPGKIAVLYRRDRQVARALRELLARSLSEPPSFDAAARSLGLAPRTLHRRLAEEGTSFREVKSALRREAALARLQKTRLSIADIASDLGVSEPSAFFRAFQSWTGEAPSAHRRRHGPR